MTEVAGAELENLQAEAESARKRLFGAIDKLDTRAKVWARGAVELTRVSGWGIAGAVALWAGVALLTRTRERERPATAIVRLPARRRPSFATRMAFHALRSGAALVGFLATRAWAMRMLEERRMRQDGSSVPPHVGQLGVAAQPLLAAELSPGHQVSGTSDA